MRKVLLERGGEIADLAPAEAEKFVQAEAAQWARIVKEVGFTQ
jgi:tripartite-type tricarboxylate transporter receptor subunit TctC